MDRKRRPAIATPSRHGRFPPPDRRRQPRRDAADASPVWVEGDLRRGSTAATPAAALATGVAAWGAERWSRGREGARAEGGEQWGIALRRDFGDRAIAVRRCVLHSCARGGEGEGAIGRFEPLDEMILDR